MPPLGVEADPWPTRRSIRRQALHAARAAASDACGT
jgi:hypothetical protein